MRLERYYVFDRDGDNSVVFIPKRGQRIWLGGFVYDHPEFPDGSHVQTSMVKKMTKETAVTQSGSVYNLGEYHPDYKELMDVSEQKIPIITQWKLNGHKKYGISLVGTGCNFSVAGTVSRQDGNFVWINGERYYVVWFNLIHEEASMMWLTGEYCGLDPDTFDLYLGIKIRPKLV